MKRNKDGTRHLEPMMDREGGQSPSAFKEGVKRFIKLRSEGQTEDTALARSGLPMNKGVIHMLRKRPDVQRGIAQGITKKLSLVKMLEDSLGKLDSIIGAEELPYVCEGCGGKAQVRIPPELVIKTIEVFLSKVMGRQDVLTLREKAQMEDDPESRVDLARKILEQVEQAAHKPLPPPYPPPIETTAETKPE